MVHPPMGVMPKYSTSPHPQGNDTLNGPFSPCFAENRVFFYHVLQGLRGEAEDKKGNVTFAGLASYVNQEVPLWIAKEVREGAKQSPNVKSDYSTEPILLRPLDANVKKEPERAKAPFGERKAKELQKAWAEYLGRKVEEEVDLGGGVTMTLLLIPPGTFRMGSPKDEKDRVDSESLHEVEISRPFYLGKYEVTQEQYEKLMEKAPSYFAATGGGKESVKGENTKSFPVEQVSWEGAEAFCQALGRKARRAAELPSEAQWEYACRAGTETPFHFGGILNGAEANCDGKYPYGSNNKGRCRGRVCKVGEYDANAWGLHDMHGNVSEWCKDYYGPYEGLKAKDPLRADKADEYLRVVRGGSWFDFSRDCRAAYRVRYAPERRYFSLGFRVALRLD